MAHGSRKTAALFPALPQSRLASVAHRRAPRRSPPSGSPPPTLIVEPAQVFRRGRPPIYPYYYAPPRRPGGWSFYFGPVPYAKGDYETQALQRVYPQLNYPPSMRYWTPQSGF